MIEYGYINENGCLTSKILEPYIERYKDGEEIKERTVPVEEQAENLVALGWKPVDLIDNSKVEVEAGYCVNINAYDAGDHISYQYEKVFDNKELSTKVKKLKRQLSDGDYKVIKCYEASLAKEDLPYKVERLCFERNIIRMEINRLEEILNSQDSNV